MYGYLPPRASRVLSTLVDVVAISFYAYAGWLVARYALAVDNEPMTTINWNKSHVYWLAFAGFALMAMRSVQVAVENWRRGFSPLQNPGFFDTRAGERQIERGAGCGRPIGKVDRSPSFPGK